MKCSDSIYIKNDRGSTSIWIPESVIVQYCDVDKEYLRTKARYMYSKSVPEIRLKELKTGIRKLLPDSGKSWRFGIVHRQNVYCYDNIPNRAPKYLRSKLPSKKELVEMSKNSDQESDDTFHEYCNSDSNKPNLINEALTLKLESVSLKEDINYYMYERDYTLSAPKALNYAKRKATLQVISDFEANKIYKEKGIRTEAEFFQIACSLTAGYGLKTGGSLRKEIHYFNKSEDKREHVVSNKEGNQNARIIGLNKVISPETGEVFNIDIHEAIFYHAWLNPGHHGKLRKQHVYELYEKEIKRFGLVPLSQRTIEQYINKYSTKAKASLERDGQEYFTDKYLPQIKQFKPKYVGSLWAADFSGSKLYYKVQKKNRKTGKMKWDKESFYLFRIVDAASGYIVGWSISNTKGENWATVRAGLRMAQENSNGYFARELVTDNAGVFKSNQGKLRLLFDKPRAISKYHKRANIAETYVRLLNQQARHFDAFVGKTSFDATHIDNMANPDYISLEKLGTKEEVLGQLVALIDKWNNTERPDGTIPSEEFKNKPKNPGLKKVEEQPLRYALGNTTKMAIGRQVGSVIVENEGQKFFFQIPDWAKSINKIDKMLGGCPDLKVLIHWDSTGADIHTPDDKYILSATKGTLSHPSEFEVTEESQAAFEEGKKEQARMQRDARDFADSVNAARQSLDFSDDDIERIADELSSSGDELSYSQRAVLNGGRAKDEHNAFKEKALSKKFFDIDDDEDFEINVDATNEY